MKHSTVVAAGVLAFGLGAVVAPTATAQDFGNTVEYSQCSDRFRLPWQPATPTTNVVLSPFGTADMHCASWHGVTQAYQVDPWGNKHRINPAKFVVPLPFYVWDPATF